MTCDECRDGLSAQLDGESGDVSSDALDAHLARCVACRAWYDDAAQVTRLARTAPAGGAVDVVDDVLHATPSPQRLPIGLILRVGLSIVAFAQLLLGGLQLLGVEVAANHIHVGAGGAGHIGGESAVWDVAVGAGFLWIAGRRGRPTGALPILTVFVAGLVILNVNDLIGGRTDLAHVATHSFVAVGYLIVLALLHPATEVHQPPSERIHGSGGAERLPDSGPTASVTPIRGARRAFGGTPTEASKAA